MNRYFLIATLFMPAITHGMDKLTQKMSGLKLPISSKSPAKSAALPVPPATPVDNNNATLQSKPELKHLVALLQNPNDSVEQLQKTDALFKSEFAQLEHSLYGPVLYDLAQHAQILRAKIEEKEKTKQSIVGNIQTTIAGRLNDLARQEELLQYSLYMTPYSVLPTIAHINFCTAMHSFKNFLELQPAGEVADSFLKIKASLDQHSKNLHQQGLANTELACSSKLAAFALCLNDIIALQNNSYSRDALKQWADLIPPFVGVELAYGQQIFNKEHAMQADRCAVVHEKYYDFIGVFDGHGGKQASSYFRNHLIKYIKMQPDFDQKFLAGDENAIRDLIVHAYAKANSAIREYLSQPEHKSSEGSTALICFIPRDRTKKSMFVNLGDGEAGWVKNGTYTSLITYLHNTTNLAEKERIQKEHPDDQSAIVVDIGGTTERVKGKLEVTRSFGNILNDYISVIPDFYWLKLPADAVLFLCTDGLLGKEPHKQNRTQDICKIIETYKDEPAGVIACALIEVSKPCEDDNKAVVVYKS